MQRVSSTRRKAFPFTGRRVRYVELCKRKGVEFCCDCDDFPCEFLAPTADKAAQYPHNMKVYNLCRIKKVGLERWIEEEAGQIRKKYFTGKFVVGKGQAG